MPEGAVELAQRGRDVPGEMPQLRPRGQLGEGPERLHEALDRGPPEAFKLDRKPRPLRIVLKQLCLHDLRQLGVGIAQQRGQVIGGRAEPQPLEIDQVQPLLVPEDVARLQVAMKEHLGRAVQPRHRAGQFLLDAGDLRLGQPATPRQHVFGKVVAFPAIESRPKIFHVRQPRAHGPPGALLVQAQHRFQRRLVQRAPPVVRQAALQVQQAFVAQILHDAKVLPRPVEQDLRHGYADLFQEACVADKEDVFRARRIVTHQHRGPGAALQPREAALRTPHARGGDRGPGRRHAELLHRPLFRRVEPAVGAAHQTGHRAPDHRVGPDDGVLEHGAGRELRTGQQRLVLAEASTRQLEQVAQLVQVAVQAGDRSRQDLDQAELNLAGFRATVPELELGLRQSLTSLATLTALPVEQVQAQVGTEARLMAVPPAPAAGLPSDLLNRRPDLRGAERDLQAANADVGVAVAERYPRFSLVGNAGWNAIQSGSLLQNASRTWSLGPQFSLPLFNQGQLKQQVRVNQAAYDASLATYHKAVLTALADVDVAFTRLAQDERRREQVLAGVAQQQGLLDLAQAQFQAGDIARTTLLQAEGRLLSQQDQGLQAQAQSLTALVSIYKALGGGWE